MDTHYILVWTIPFQILGLLCFLIAKRKNLALGLLLALLAPEVFFLVAAVIGANRFLDGYDSGGFVHLELLIDIIVGLIANSICSLMTTGCLVLFYRILAHRRNCSFWDFFNKTKTVTEDKI